MPHICLDPVNGFLAVVLALGDQHTIDASAGIMCTVSWHADKNPEQPPRASFFRRSTADKCRRPKINGGTGAEDQEKIYMRRWGTPFCYSIHFHMKWLNTDAPHKTESTKRPRSALWDTGRYSSTRLDTSGRLASGNLCLLVEYCALSFSSAGSGGLQ